VVSSSGYPEQYLARCKLPKPAIQALISQFLRLPSSATSASAAESSAAQLYITLYFIPEALHSDNDLMKDVVSEGFRHSWVVTWAPGHVADVSLQWQRYRAARNALGAVMAVPRAKDMAAACRGKMRESQKTINLLMHSQVEKVMSSLHV